MTHDEFMQAMLRPTFVWRMARAMKDSLKPSQRKSALTRMLYAQKDIDEIVVQRYHTIRRDKTS